MRLRVTHTTTYRYSAPVSLCHNLAHLLPRDDGHQHCLDARLSVAPTPGALIERRDFFGNRTHYFDIQTPHRELVVSAVSEVDTLPLAALPPSPPWEQARERLATLTSGPGRDARGFVLGSPLVPATLAGALEYALPSFGPERPLLDAVADLNERIFSDFAYDPSFTTVVTPLTDVLEHRRGVCQDFAHLMLACLRMLGLAARYVSGYLETLPPPGQAKLQGSDASHAWVSVFLPDTGGVSGEDAGAGVGWFDFDPTNNKRPDEQYVTTAFGRDYGDVTPLKGVIIGGGEHKLCVAVDVARL